MQVIIGSIFVYNFHTQNNFKDIILIIGNILGTISLSEVQLELGDLNQDGIVDILDIVQVINLILSS